jgi:hypothetical protein
VNHQLEFGRWLTESTNAELYSSTVEAFPRTRYRQHATDPIKIVRLEWVPYLGVKTLFISSLAQNTDKGTSYRPMILFKGVKYGNPGQGMVEIVASDEKQYAFERLSHNDTDLMVRCDCADFRWRFRWYDHVDRSLYGNVSRKKYENKGGPPANPLELPGMCKHLMVLFKTLDEAGVLLAH